MNDRIRAAGGVVWRRDGHDGDAGVDAGQLRCAVIHRPHRDDWSLPKGKAEVGESPVETARREVSEETGLAVEVGEPLGEVDYVLPDGRPKTVSWWAMRLIGGEFVANDEADALEWLTPPDAERRLSHDTDRVVLARFVASR